mmetsp:Transcript_4905/g.9721  ORF Transcript_4905/g.9721 Transcript_4905/m.9721 type:complete len:86 (+) Transcript_4905:86-343(+)
MNKNKVIRTTNKLRTTLPLNDATTANVKHCVKERNTGENPGTLHPQFRLLDVSSHDVSADVEMAGHVILKPGRNDRFYLGWRQKR